MPPEKQMIADDCERFPNRATRHSARILLPSREQICGWSCTLTLRFSLSAQMHLPTSIGTANPISNCKARRGCRESEPVRCPCNGLRVDFASINRQALRQISVRHTGARRFLREHGLRRLRQSVAPRPPPPTSTEPRDNIRKDIPARARSDEPAEQPGSYNAANGSAAA